MRTAGAGALFLALAVLLTWPLVTLLGTHVPGKAPDDNVNFLWNLWWMREAMAAGVSPLHSDWLFAPFGVDLVLHTHSAINAIAAATLLANLTIVQAQNVLLIASIALNGFCTCLLARRLTSEIGPAIAAGVYFASAPYFAGHLLGHFNLISAFCLPLFALALLTALDRPGIVRAGLAGLALALSAYADYYYTVYLLVFTITVLLWRWLDARVTIRRRRLSALDAILIGLLVATVALAIWSAVSGGAIIDVGPWTVSLRTGFNLRIGAWILAIAIALRWLRPRLHLRVPDRTLPRRDLVALVTAFAVAAVVTAPLWIPAAQLVLAGDYRAPARLWRSSTEGIDLVSLAAGNPFHPWWRSTGEWLYATLGMSTIESTAWLGIAAIGFLLWRRDWIRLPGARLWMAVAVVFFVWACGPYLRVAGANTGPLLPETLLHYVPGISNARIPGRAIVVVYLAIGVLLAYALTQAPVRRRRGAVVWLTAAVLFDFISAPTHLYRLDVPAVYRQVAALPAGTVWEWPFGIADGFGEYGALDNATMYYQTVHGHPLVGGFVARLPPRLIAAHEETPGLREVLALSAGRTLTDDERAGAVESVRAFMNTHGIRYVVVNLTAASPALQSLADALGLRVIAESNGRRVLALE